MKNLEQLYMIEIFVEKVSIYLNDDEDVTSDQKLGVKINFGPVAQFQLNANSELDKKSISTNRQGTTQRTTVIRAGKSFLFPSYPDTLVLVLRKFPLEIAVWTNEIKESSVYFGKMIWDSRFADMVMDTETLCKKHLPLAQKQKTNIYTEYSCALAGEISIIIRISTLGGSLTTDFQQGVQDPDHFLFRTNMENNKFDCTRAEGDNPNFCMAGSLYEPTTIADPQVLNVAKDQSEVLIETQNLNNAPMRCQRGPLIKKYPIDKIRMGDITGPCGNKKCLIAHKIKKYIQTNEYKVKFSRLNETDTDILTKESGACICGKEKSKLKFKSKCDLFQQKEHKIICSGCGGVTQAAKTCKDKNNDLFGIKKSISEKLPEVNVFNVTDVPKPKMMEQNIRGELTNLSSMTIEEQTLKDALQTYLNIQSPTKLNEIADNVFSTLLLFGIRNDDEGLVSKMLDMGTDVNAQDTEGKTALHEAILQGNAEIVEYLLTNGASVHLKTRNGEGPLITAVLCENTNIINILLKCGAHLADGDIRSVTEVIVNAIKNGSISKLKALKHAGAKFDIVDELKQTPLHKAVLSDRPEIAEYLIKQETVKVEAKDILGYTARGYAEKLNRLKLIKLFDRANSKNISVNNVG